MKQIPMILSAFLLISACSGIDPVFQEKQTAYSSFFTKIETCISNYSKVTNVDSAIAVIEKITEALQEFSDANKSIEKKYPSLSKNQIEELVRKLEKLDEKLQAYGKTLGKMIGDTMTKYKDNPESLLRIQQAVQKMSEVAQME